MNCPACAHQNPSDSRFCLECGASLAVRCGSCDAELPAGAKFCNQCGTATAPMPATSSGAVAAPAEPARDPRAYTPAHLADKIVNSRSAMEGERKQITIVFADVKGSMELAEQVDPEEWHQILDRFFQILSDGIHRFEGTVNQYTGDGIMALFGAPIAHEDHAQRACYAALHLQDELRAYANELRVERGLSFAVRIGINSGEVVVGKIGDDLRMDYTAQGHTVGLAKRMEQLAESGRTYLTQATAEIVRGYFELESLGPSRIAGSTDPIEVFALEGIGSVRTRLDRSRARGFSKFVGRDSEKATLQAALDRALDGNAQVVGVVAEAGIGKSRLCAEFLEKCRSEGISVQQTSGFAHTKNVPLLPVLELLRNVFGIEDRDAPSIARQKIAGQVVLGDETLTRALPLVFEFMGVPDPERPPPSVEPGERDRRLFEVIRRLTRARSERQPAVWLIEDLHWLDPASDAFLGLLIEAVPGTRTLLLLNTRPEYRAEWMQKSFYQQLPLHPLRAEDIRALLDDLLGSDASLEGLAEKIRERTEGNPFFIEELVHALAEEGVLQGSKGAYKLAKPIDQLAIPDSVHSLLAARIDRLADRAKQVLQAASVIGSTFFRSMLAKVAELPDDSLDEALRTLVSAELVYEEYLYPEPEYAFRHPLTRDVAYGSQLAARRARVHAAAARALEDGDETKLDERAALIAHHWEEAGEAWAAARWHQRAALWSGRARSREALRHWLRVYELLEDVADSDEAFELGVEARAALLSMSVLTSADAPVDPDRLIEESREIASRSGSVRVRTRMLGACGSAKMLRGDTSEALEMLREGVELAGESDDVAAADLVPYLSLATVEVEGPPAAIAVGGAVREAFRATPRARQDARGSLSARGRAELSRALAGLVGPVRRWTRQSGTSARNGARAGRPGLHGAHPGERGQPRSGRGQRECGALVRSYLQGDRGRPAGTWRIRPGVRVRGALVGGRGGLCRELGPDSPRAPAQLAADTGARLARTGRAGACPHRTARAGPADPAHERFDDGAARAARARRPAGARRRRRGAARDRVCARARRGADRDDRGRSLLGAASRAASRADARPRRGRSEPPGARRRPAPV
jgi:class 3 adenylate cyclase